MGRAKAKGVDLFTSGKDSDFVIGKYDKSYHELIKAVKLNYEGMRWTDCDVIDLFSVAIDCKHLRWLNLSQNDFTTLPDSLGQLRALTSLCLNRCYSLTRLPDSIGQLQKLQYLFSAECSSLTELPDS